MGGAVRCLIACEFSGVVRSEFRKLGHDAWSCDLLSAEDGSPYHFQRDVFDVLAFCGKWDLMIYHWPCTRLCNSGVRWLFGGKGKIPDHPRWVQMESDAHCFRNLLIRDDVPRIAGENPIMHRYAKEIVGVNQSQIIQPWQFGHGEIKATCLWLKNLPPLKPTNIVEGRSPRVHHATPGPDRWKERSRTLPGIARAMAEQWGNL